MYKMIRRTNGKPFTSLNHMNDNVNKKIFGGIMDTIGKGISRAKEAVSAIFSSNRLPKSFRDTLEKHKDKKIKTIEICREPLSGAINKFANLLTGGNFEKVAEKQGESGFYHLYSIITLDDGTRMLYEKNERPVLQVSNKEPSDKAQCINTSGKNKPLGDFIGSAIKSMGEDNYISYDPLKRNCQDFLMGSLNASGLLNSGLSKFIKQDLDELIEKTPEFSKQLASGATGIAGKLREIWEELTARSGAIIRRLNRI